MGGSRRQRRPVLIVSRTEAGRYLNRVIVAPITRTVRSIPTEIVIDESSGLREHCVASFDNLSPQLVSLLTKRVGKLTFARTEICRVLGALSDC